MTTNLHLAQCRTSSFRVIGLIGVFAVSCFAAGLRAQTVTVTPVAGHGQYIFVKAENLGGGTMVETHSHTVTGNTIAVRMVQDGITWQLPPPLSFTEFIGPLAPGSYSLVVTIERSDRPTFTAQLSVDVP